MMKDLLQDITIYHKNNSVYERYPKQASVRNTSILNRNKTGVSTSESSLIRVFDKEGYNDTWKCQKGDVIVLKDVSDSIEQAPLTELRKKYGKDFVCEVQSIDIFNFKDEDIKELNHIKIRGK